MDARRLALWGTSPQKTAKVAWRGRSTGTLLALSRTEGLAMSFELPDPLLALETGEDQEERVESVVADRRGSGLRAVDRPRSSLFRLRSLEPWG